MAATAKKRIWLKVEGRSMIGTVVIEGGKIISSSYSLRSVKNMSELDFFVLAKKRNYVVREIGNR